MTDLADIRDLFLSMSIYDIKLHPSLAANLGQAETVQGLLTKPNMLADGPLSVVLVSIQKSVRLAFRDAITVDTSIASRTVLA